MINKLAGLNPLGMLALSTAAALNKIPRLGNTFIRKGVPTRVRNRFRNGLTLTRTQKRNRRRRRRNGLEINKAEGGFKNITIPYKTQGMGINTYGRIVAVHVGDNWQYGFQPESDNYATHAEFNLIHMLNNSTEFKTRLQTTSQYKLIGIRICIMNNRVPEAKDTLSKLLVYVNTTKVTVIDPKVQNNVMQLNMNTIGTKNYNFNINSTNMLKDYVGWLNGDELYRGNVYMHFASMDNNLLHDTETTVMLGTVKVTFSILTRIQDYVRNNEPQLKENPEEKIERLEKQLLNMQLISKHEPQVKKQENSDSEYDGDDEFIEELKEH